MQKWKIISEYDTDTGTHTRFKTRMFGDEYQLRLEADGTYSILKKDRFSNAFFVIKEGLLGIKPAKKYFAKYIL